MSHDFHESLPGFHADQILIDGCAECESRAQREDHGVSTLDTANFGRAVSRALEWERSGLPTLSDAERPLLSTLLSVYVQLVRAGLIA